MFGLRGSLLILAASIFVAAAIAGAKDIRPLFWGFYAPVVNSTSAVVSPKDGDIAYVNSSGFWGYDAGWVPLGGSSALHVNVTSISGNITLTDDNDIVFADASSAAITVSLPSPGSVVGKVYQIKKTDTSLANSVSITGTSLSTTLNTKDEAVRIVSDGSNWLAVDRAIPSVWLSFTPSSYQGLSSVTDDCQWRRSGDSVEVRCKITPGSNNGSEARIGLPTNMTSSNTSKIGSIQVAGNALRSDGGTAGAVMIEPSVTYFTFANQGSFSKLVGSNMISAGSTYSFVARVPISGWN